MWFKPQWKEFEACIAFFTPSMLKLFKFHMNSIHFSQRKPLRHDKSVTDEQKDHNALFYLIVLVGIKSNGGAEKHVCKHTLS